MPPNSLVDAKTLKKFGDKDSLDIGLLIEYIKSLKNKLPKINKRKPFIEDKLRTFKISLDGQSMDNLNENISSFFSNCVNWKSSKTQFNITPPVTISSVASSSIASLLNPNATWDVVSGGFADLEIEIVKYLSSLVEWKNSSGVFVFGGTATNMYAIKIGISNCHKKSHQKGVERNIYVLSNDEGHSCHVTLCNWLGIGTENCIRLKTNREGIIDINKLINKAELLIKEGKKIACIILNAGTNFNGKFDPIRETKEKIDDLVKRYGLDYTPHLHADSVIGWVFLLFKDYNFDKNELRLPENTLRKIKRIYDKATEIEFADSFGADFHKSGFCPYISSVFVTKDVKDWNKITGDDSIFTHQSFNLGKYKPGQYTLETSRPVNGVISAYSTLNSLGINGIRKIVANFLYISNDLRTKIKESNNFINCNEDAFGWATLFLINSRSAHLSFDNYYNEKNEENIKASNNIQKDFYDFLMNKYKNKLPWNLGYARCYRKNRFDIPISALKSYPMSPFITIKDNKDLIIWLNKNYEEFKNAKNKSE